MKLISWNVNGINSCANKGLLDFMRREAADVYCFQEVKVAQARLNPAVCTVEGLAPYWLFSKKSGRSGVVMYSKKAPLRVIEGIGDVSIDSEGRVLTLEFTDFFLVNAYFPHANRELSRLDFKLRFNQKFESFVQKLRTQKPVVIASDFNVAHTPLDLANPKQNEHNAGFTLEERNWFDSFLKKGFVDSFRKFVSDGGHYTWWTFRSNARERNIGWRIDYFAVDSALESRIQNSEILSSVKGSDHCPIRLTLK